MIEKKISYEINIEKPSKTKPVTQGGVLNYLGKQKTVTAPRRWRSSPEHPIAHLAYITKDEEKILIDLNLYGSLKGKPNKGPFGLPSLQGSGGGAGGGDGGGGDGGGGGDSGDSGDAGDSGPGGSDDGTGHGGPGPGVGGDDGGVGQASEGTNDTAADAAAANAAAAAAQQDAQNQASDMAAMVSAIGQEAAEQAAQEAEVDMTMPAMQTMQEKVSNFVASQISPAAIAGRMIGSALFGTPGAVMGSLMGSSIARGVTGPSDDTQEQSSVQTGPTPGSGSSEGIMTIANYAPLTNVSTGDNTADAIRTRLENLLKVPTTQTVFQNQNVNPLINYTLSDLYNLRS